MNQFQPSYCEDKFDLETITRPHPEVLPSLKRSNYQGNALTSRGIGGKRQRRLAMGNDSHEQVLEVIINDWDREIQDLFKIDVWKKRVREVTGDNRFRSESTEKAFVEAVMSLLFENENNEYVNVILTKMNPNQRIKFYALLKKRQYESLNELANSANGMMVLSSHEMTNSKMDYDPDDDEDFKPARSFQNRRCGRRCHYPVSLREVERKGRSKSSSVSSLGKLKKKNSVTDFSKKVLDVDLKSDMEKRDTSPNLQSIGLKSNYETNLNMKTSSTKKVQIRIRGSSDRPCYDPLREVEETIEMYPKPPSGPTLTLHMLAVIEDALQKPEKEVVASGFSLKLLQGDLAIINDNKEWLIDVNMDFYLELIRERSTQPGYPSVYVFHSFFFPLFCVKDGGGYSAVKETTGEEDIFKYDLVFFPINLSQHWRLIVVECAKKRITCYDSMSHHNNKYTIKQICSYLNREHRRKFPEKYPDLISLEMNNNGTQKPNENCFKGNSCLQETRPSNYISRSDWLLTSPAENEIPQQKNAIDCGIFVLQYAEYISRAREFDFDQSHVPYFRKRMMYEILTKKLLTSIEN